MAGVERQPVADEAAHRQAAIEGGADLERVEDGERVRPEPRQGRRLLRHVGLAVAALVVADDAEMLRQERDLRVPHPEARAERPTSRAASGEPVTDLTSLRAIEPHEIAFDFPGVE